MKNQPSAKLKFKRNSVSSTSKANTARDQSQNADKSKENFDNKNNKENFNFLNDHQVLCSLDKDILDLCDELESLGGGISTKLDPI